MTLEEKAGQLQLMASAWGGGAALALNPPQGNSDFSKQTEEARQGQLTGVFNGNGATMARILQNAAVRDSRLKIPLIFAADIIHGHRTIFPVPRAVVARRNIVCPGHKLALQSLQLVAIATGKRRDVGAGNLLGECLDRVARERAVVGKHAQPERFKSLERAITPVIEWNALVAGCERRHRTRQRENDGTSRERTREPHHATFT